MNSVSFLFDRAKAIETILYLSPRVSDSDIYGICKLVYLADKTSLERYARFIFGETYCAMEQGATPSQTYDLLKDEARQGLVQGLQVDGNQVIAKREADLEYLSESDIECLDHVIEVWGNVPYWVRREEAHDDAYRQAWAERGDKRSVPMPIESIAAIVDDSGELIEYLSDSDDE